MQGFLSGRVRPFKMPPEKGKRRDDSWRNARRDTVAERERSDEIVLDALIGVTAAAVMCGLPVALSAVFQAVAM